MESITLIIRGACPEGASTALCARESLEKYCCHLLPDVLESLSIEEMNLVLLSLTQRAPASWWAGNGAQGGSTLIGPELIVSVN
jgi:hypothetical protein